MNTSITITTPEIALFDKSYLETMVKTFIKTMAQNMKSAEEELPVLSASDLAGACSVDEAEQEMLDAIHLHFHKAV